MTELVNQLLDPSQGTMMLIGAIILATFVSEDLTCLAVSLMVAQGDIKAGVGVFACLAGIFIGDVGLYLVGRWMGRGVLRLKFIRKRLNRDLFDAWSSKFDKLGWTAVLASRFVPGTRLPVYLAAGVVGHKPGRFILWLFIAVLLWAPLIVLLGAAVGPAIMEPLRLIFGKTWLALLAGLGVMFILFRLALRAISRFGRHKFIASISMLWRWEFWPTWVFQAPMVPLWAWLTLRHGGPTVWTAANPGIPDGGVVGESKADILDRLPQNQVADYYLLRSGTGGDRTAELEAEMDRRGWELPIVIKPDGAYRAHGFKVIRTMDEAADYLERFDIDLLAQAYHPGPYEAGVFWYRPPGGDRGRIYSITDKIFPFISGDGASTLEELIWRHPRYKMQTGRFLERHSESLKTVLPKGERLQLVLAGTHSQGALFKDGGHLITPELERALNDTLTGFKGFHIGRFDIRYSDVEEFKAGRDLTIVELNGVTAESTNIYDPDFSIFRAYRILGRQYALSWRIGRANIKAGAKATSPLTLLRHVFSFYRSRELDMVSD